MKKVKTLVLLTVIIVTYFCIFLSSYNGAAQKIEDYVRTKSTDTFIQSVSGYDNFSIVIMIISVCMFEIFRRMHIPTSRFINFLGSATFMIYLIHDSNLFYSIWRNYDWIKLLYFHPWLFLPKLLMFVVLTFAACTGVYLLYLGTGKLWSRCKFVVFKS